MVLPMPAPLKIIGVEGKVAKAILVRVKKDALKRPFLVGLIMIAEAGFVILEASHWLQAILF